MHGELSEATLARVGDALAACDAEGTPALVALHHPPIPPAGAHNSPVKGREHHCERIVGSATLL